jgi:hypothetical protein
VGTEKATLGDGVDTQAVARLFLIALVGVCVVLAACGGDDDADEPAVPGDADQADVEVIKAWVDTLRRGDVEGAAEYFAIPSVAENGILFEIEDAGDAVDFNEALPCGAELVSAESQGKFTTATFRLTERPGPGTCGDGVGESAQTAFVIEDGKIVEWRRVGISGTDTPGQTT